MHGRRRMWLVILILFGIWLAIVAPIVTHRMIQAGLQEDLLLWLPLVDDFRDRSSHEVEVSVNGDLRMTPEGAYYDGDGDFLSLPTQPLAGKPFAISVWLKLEGSHQTYGILEQQSGRGRGQHLHVQLRHMKPFLSFYASNTQSDRDLSVGDGWTHMVFQYTGEEAQIWVDGKLDTAKKQLPYEGTTGVFFIGKTRKWSNVPSSDWQGYMRDLRIYDRLLKSYEVRTLARKPWEDPEVAEQEGKDTP